MPGKVELLRWRRLVQFLQIAGVAELADALHQNPMITTGKDAVVAISLPISTSLSCAWDHGRTADDWPTVKWIRFVRLQQFLQSFMERRRPKQLLNPNRSFESFLGFSPEGTEKPWTYTSTCRGNDAGLTIRRNYKKCGTAANFPRTRCIGTTVCRSGR